MILLPPPRKKKRVFESPGTFLPIPTGAKAGLQPSASTWPCYHAKYRGSSIYLNEIDEANEVWYNGYYGQWTLSGSELRDSATIDIGTERLLEKMNSENDILKINRIAKNKRLRLETKTFVIGEQTVENNPLNKQFNRTHYINLQSLKNTDQKGSSSTEITTIGNNSKHKERDICTDGLQIKGILCQTSDLRNESNYNNYSNHSIEDYKIDSDEDMFGTQNEDDDESVYGTPILALKDDLANSWPSLHGQLAEDHYQPQETLILCPEEAMFLSYALGCLVLTDENTNQQMTIDAMWEEFTEENSLFAIRYCVYHHFRAKGWVVKCGLKFGAEWVLYPVGPPFYHAQYTVAIEVIWGDTLTRDTSLSPRQMNWTALAAIDRLNTHVAKAPIICQVIRPRNLSEGDLRKPSCLSQLAVQELFLSRWDPEANENV